MHDRGNDCNRGATLARRGKAVPRVFSRARRASGVAACKTHCGLPLLEARNPRSPLGRPSFEEFGWRLPTLGKSLSFTPEPRLTIAKETNHVRPAGFHW